MSSVVHITSVDQFNNAINNVNFATTIVDFSATWCGPCVGIAPFYEELAKNNTEMQFLSVDVDQFPDLAQLANVRAMPTFVVYKDGVLTQEKLQGADRHGLTEIVKNNRKAVGNKQPNTDYQSNTNKDNFQETDQIKPEPKKKRRCTIL